ncbi:SHOCT domain-containing protein [Lentzea sp. NEAU-D7]|uniref:SHOCT domain-containing protein n=1 Tax=Lentzea sp. NEAU-D7 TaxID=2994667 RepID=UPI00224B12F7|nr:SHOCT domain-containing protein [Lentzea sp. NEAU-D7]MCX2949128.1 SHOCT domain-containing protein [Lentzea sp. NEAU-D7]
MTMHWYYGNPMGWGGMAMMVLGLVLFLGGLTVLAVVLLRRLPRTPQIGSATRILEERLARGEIDADEFERLRRTIESR